MGLMTNEYFPLPLDTRFLGGRLWELLEPFEYHRRNGDIIRPTPGFITDFGSKPRITWIFVGHPADEGAYAYVIHDWLIAHSDLPRAEIDRIFLEALRDCGVAYLKRHVMYFFVRLYSYF